MNVPSLRRLLMREDLNFLLTNRVPRIALTRLVGAWSRIESPTLTAASIAVWRLFTDLDLSDAVPRRYRSLRECFTRSLVPGARPFDPDPQTLASPCDAIVGTCGPVPEGRPLQIKGMDYPISALFGPTQDPAVFTNGCYATLRLTSAMYHRFHAPHDGTVEHVTHIDGDTWNVNPIALARVEQLFCRNERAVIRFRLDSGGDPIALVPVAAILVAGIRLHALDLVLRPRHRGPAEFSCRTRYAKGEEMGWFEHGSTILVFAPPGFTLAEGIGTGTRIQAGQALMRRPNAERPPPHPAR
jgi:phosphatidylserine decarboxylase